MADIYKRVPNQEQKNRPLQVMSTIQSEKVQATIQNFVNFFKSA